MKGEKKMLRHKFYILLIALLSSLTVAAQHDVAARNVLDKVSASYNECKGMKIAFKGTQIGTLWLKGDCFVLDCGGVKSWFDGKTQWSYVSGNEEVNISSPTPEEIQAVNPYALITMYRKGFSYLYMGMKSRNGKRGHEISLIPDNQQDIRMITLSVGEDNIPFYIGVDMRNGHYEEFVLTGYEKIDLVDEFFHFKSEEYPNAEVIDLR